MIQQLGIGLHWAAYIELDDAYNWDPATYVDGDQTSLTFWELRLHFGQKLLSTRRTLNIWHFQD